MVSGCNSARSSWKHLEQTQGEPFPVAEVRPALRVLKGPCGVPGIVENGVVAEVGPALRVLKVGVDIVQRMRARGVAEVRPALRVLKVDSVRMWRALLRGCRGSTRFEGTESIDEGKLVGTKIGLQRFDPL